MGGGVLGGGGGTEKGRNGKSIREKMLEAAERRR